ncbi:MAG: hypothetical protein WCW44_00925 [archaeon]
MPKCGVCGSEDVRVFYNGRMSAQYIGIREKVSHCGYCRTMEVKKEVL